MQTAIVHRIFHWYDFWPLAVILLLMAGVVWLLKEEEKEEDSMHVEGKLPLEDDSWDNANTKESEREQD